MADTTPTGRGPLLDARLLTGLRGVDQVTGPVHVSFAATWFDTADLRLAGAGGSLRRTDGRDGSWQATVPGGAAVVDVPAARSPDEVPAELADLVLAYTGGEPLRPVARVTVDRRRWLLADANHRHLAEVSDDAVSAEPLDRRRGTAGSWRELRVDADDRLAAAVTKRLDKAGLAPPTTDDVARVLGGRARSARARPGRHGSAGQAVTGYLSDQLVRLRAADVAVRRAEPDGVHDLRAAVRRIRDTLRTFRSVVGRSRAIALSAELKWLSDLLGEARDAEVVSGRIVAELDATPTDLVLGPVRAEVDRLTGRGVADTRAAVRLALAGPRYLALLSALDALVADPEPRGRAAAPARQVLPALVAKAYRRSRRAVGMAKRATAGPDRDAALHRVRRTTKRLRYASEVAAPVVGRPAERLRRRAKALTRTLGDRHDLVLLRARLRELGVRTHLAGNSAFTFGLLHGRAGAHADRLDREYSARWRRVAARRATKWLPGT